MYCSHRTSQEGYYTYLNGILEISLSGIETESTFEYRYRTQKWEGPVSVRTSNSELSLPGFRDMVRFKNGGRELFINEPHFFTKTFMKQ